MFAVTAFVERERRAAIRALRGNDAARHDRLRAGLAAKGPILSGALIAARVGDDFPRCGVQHPFARDQVEVHDDAIAVGTVRDRRNVHPADVEIDLRRFVVLREQRLDRLRTLGEQVRRQIRLQRRGIEMLISAIHEKIRHLRALQKRLRFKIRIVRAKCRDPVSDGARSRYFPGRCGLERVLRWKRF